MFVATPPGCTLVTPTWVSVSSERSASLKPRTANLLAQYDDWCGTPTSPNTLEMFTMCPSSAANRCGKKNLQPCTTPQKFTPISQSKSSSDWSMKLPATETPALLTRIC